MCSSDLGPDRKILGQLRHKFFIRHIVGFGAEVGDDPFLVRWRKGVKLHRCGAAAAQFNRLMKSIRQERAVFLRFRFVSVVYFPLEAGVGVGDDRVQLFPD